MYCPSCGIAVTEELSFCNRCGTDLKPNQSLVLTGKPKGLAVIIPFTMILTAGLAVGGIVVVFLILMKLLEAGIPSGEAMVLPIISLLLLAGTVALLGRQLSRLIGVYLQSGDASKSKNSKVTKPELSGQSSIQIVEPRQPMSSVTEHTTRILELAHKEQSI